MKKFSALILALLLTVPVFSYGGLMNGETDVRWISTKWFDIIFPVECEPTAFELFEHADEIYEEVAASYNMVPSFRIPVVITKQTDVFNAYYTNGYFNHIVLFDTVPEENMNVFSETILGTFKHELTHAFSINMTNGFWTWLRDTFGDIYNVGPMMTLTQLFKEGASVAEESKSGEGRLNDGFYLHMVRQLKLLGQFPTYYDVAGARDIFPSGSMSYGFGGPFTQYVQQKFGMEKYADFWYRCVNVYSLSIEGAFKKAFGSPLNVEWECFKESIKIPEISSNAEDVAGVYDFFKTNSLDAGMNRQSSRYNSYTAGKNGFACIDSSCSTVLFFEQKDDGTFCKPREILYKDYINSISFSSDGKFLAVGAYYMNAAAAKNHMYVYNVENGSFFHLNEDGLRNGTVLFYNGEYYLACVKNECQSESIVIYKLSLNDREKVTDAQKITSINFDDKDGRPLFYSLNDMGNGKLSFVKSENICESLCFINIENAVDGAKGIVEEYAFDKNINVRYASSFIDTDGSECVSFSYVNGDSFPRLGIFKNGEIVLYKTDISGGVYFPLMQKNNTVVYSSYMVYDYRLFEIKLNEFSSGSVLTKKVNPLKVSVAFGNAVGSGIEFSEEFVAAQKKYSRLYYNDGSIIPVALMSYANYDNVLIYDQVDMIGLGFTYFTNTPWTSDTLSISAGYEVLSNTGGITLSLSGGTDTSFFKYTNDTSVIFDSKIFRQFLNNNELIFMFDFGKHSYGVISNRNFAFVGRNYYTIFSGDFSLDNLFNGNQDFYIIDENTFMVQAATFRKTGPGPYEKLALIGALLYRVNFVMPFESDETISGRSYSSLKQSYSYWENNNYVYHNIVPVVRVMLPYLIPFRYTNGMTFNLPTTLEAQLTSGSSVFFYGSADTVLFSAEIQRGIPYTFLYVNRITLDAKYEFFLTNANRNFEIIYLLYDLQRLNEMGVMDYITLTGSLDLSLNAGSAASSGLLHLTGGFKYEVRGKNAGNWSLVAGGTLKL